MMRKLDGCYVECRLGDITSQPDLDVIVNAANAWLRPGGGVSTAIHRVAGPELEEECRGFAPLRTGDAVSTLAYDLANKRVIHCLGPIYGVDRPPADLLALCYRRAMDLAVRMRMKSIGFPAISTGAFGCPVESAANVAISTVLDEVRRKTKLEHVAFILFDAHVFTIYKNVFDELSAPILIR